MTNKELIKEGVILILVFMACYLYFVLNAPWQESFYLSDIYFGGRPLDGPSSFSFFDRLFSILAFGLALIGLFPALFVIQFIQGLIQRFSSRAFNMYLLFACFISLLVSLLFFMLTVSFSSGWTLYPPLSALPEMEQPSRFSNTSYLLLAFLILHLPVLFITLRKLFKKEA